MPQACWRHHSIRHEFLRQTLGFELRFWLPIQRMCKEEIAKLIFFLSLIVYWEQKSKFQAQRFAQEFMMDRMVPPEGLWHAWRCSHARFSTWHKYVCMYVCTNTPMYVCIYLRMYVCAHSIFIAELRVVNYAFDMDMHTYIHTYVRTHVRTYIHTYIRAQMHDY